MRFASIDAIRAHAWIGNHHSDSGAFTGVAKFVSDPVNSEADRAEAIRISAYMGMGLRGRAAGVGVPDGLLIAQYLDD